MYIGFRCHKLHASQLSVRLLAAQLVQISCGLRRILGQLDLNNNVPKIGGQGFFSATRAYLGVIWANVLPREDKHQYTPEASVLVTVQQESGPVQAKWAI